MSLPIMELPVIMDNLGLIFLNIKFSYFCQSLEVSTVVLWEVRI